MPRKLSIIITFLAAPYLRLHLLHDSLHSNVQMSNVLLELLDLGDVLVATPALTPYDRRSSATVLQDDHARAVVGAFRYGVGRLQLREEQRRERKG